MTHRIAMLVSNACAPDRRVLREAQELVEAGHSVRIIAWDRRGAYPAYEEMDAIPIQRIQILAAYGAGLRRLRQWPEYARQALRHLHETDWDVIHCHDMDTLPIGYIHALRHDVRLILDAHESYPDFVAPRVPGWAAWLVGQMERYLVTRVDGLITVGERLAEHYRRWHARNVVVVRNCPPIEVLEAQPDVSGYREEWGLDDVELLVAYVGGFTRGRVILPLLEAVRDDASLGLVIVGSGPQRAQVESLAAGVERIHYLAPRIPPEQVVPTMRAADVVYYGLRADFPNNRYSSPNALYSALAAGRPLVTTDVGEISQIIQTERCGVVLEEPSPAAIGRALAGLRDPAHRDDMARRARRAAEERYNWGVARRNLLSLYEELLEDV
jgi:glycosyltransferase involved in cell wall biosynthesis